MVSETRGPHSVGMAGGGHVSDREPSREVRCRFAALSLDSPSPHAIAHPHRQGSPSFTSLGQISRSASRPRHRPPLDFLSVIEQVATLLVLGHLWRKKIVPPYFRHVVFISFQRF